MKKKINVFIFPSGNQGWAVAEHNLEEQETIICQALVTPTTKQLTPQIGGDTQPPQVGEVGYCLGFDLLFGEGVNAEIVEIYDTAQPQG